LATAHQRHADLIVINATLDADWKEFFSGGYTQQIINHANIPVLALRF
jgi:nucleotide-binding universal stress UspA family protein